jgi:hypothetical protein
VIDKIRFGKKTKMLKDELKNENMNPDQVNCAVDCSAGCVLGDRCPHKEYQNQASNFIKDTPLDKMLEMAEIARMKKASAPPKWVIPDEI